MNAVRVNTDTFVHLRALLSQVPSPRLPAFRNNPIHTAAAKMDPPVAELDNAHQSNDGGRVKKPRKRRKLGGCIPCTKRRQVSGPSVPFYIHRLWLLMRGAVWAMTCLCSPSDPDKHQPGISGEVTLGIRESEGQCPCRTSKLGLGPPPLRHFLFLALLVVCMQVTGLGWMIGFGPCCSS